MMYVKIFESLETNKSYTIRYAPHATEVNKGATFIENERKVSVRINEGELYNAIDAFFRSKLNEKRK